MIQASSFKFRPQQLCLLFIMLVCVALSHKSAFAGTPTFSMSFSPSSIAPNGVSTLTYLIDNTANDTAVTNVSFANTLPSGVTLASPVNASDTCNGQVSATAGGGTITYSLDRFGIGESCEISVDVTSSAAASYSNTTGDLTSSGGNSGTANATLTVDSSLIAFSIALSPNTISPGALSTLTYTFDNTMNSENMDGLSIDSVLPTGVEVSGQPNPTTDCTIYESGTYFGVVAEPGSDSISIGYLDVPAGTSCSVNVDVTSTTISSHTIESGDLSNSTYFSYSGGRFYNSITNLGLNSTALLTVESSILNLIVPHSVSPGSLVTLTFDLMNSNRDQEITDLTFTNDLNAALSGLTASSLPSDGFCGADSSISGSSDLTISGISLDSGSNCSFNVTLMIPSSAAAGSYTNTTSTVSYNLGGTPTTSAPVTSALNVYNPPTVSMAFLDDSVGLGEDVTLRFTVSNTDSSNSLSSGSLQLTVNESISGTTIKTLPSADACGSGSSFSSSLSTDVLNFVMSDGALTAGGSCTFDLVLTLPDTGALGDFTFTTEQVSGTVNSQSLAGNTATDILSVIGAPALSFSLSSNVALPGDTITASFALNYNENAQADATGVSFTVDLDGVLSGLASTSSAQSDVCGTSSSISGSSTLTFTDGTLSPGDSCSFSVNLQIPENADSGSVTLATSLINATVSSSSVSSVAVSQDLLISGLSGTKVFMPSAVLPGTTAVLRYTLSNSANAAEATNIAFTDNLNSVVSSLSATSLPSAPCGSSSTISGSTTLVLSSGELQPGDSCTFDVEISVPVGAAAGTYTSTSSSISATVNSSSVTANSMNTSLIVEELTVNITTTASNPTSASLIPVSVYFSRDVVNFVSSDLVLSNGSVSSFTGSGSSYLAEVTPASDGVVTIDLPANVVDDAVESSVKNPAATQLSVTYESTPAIADPSIAISSPSDSLAATGPITYTVTYTDVTLVNLTTSAITLNKTGTADAVVAVTDGDTETPTVTLSSLTGDGTLGFSIGESTARNSTKTAGSAGPASTFTVDNTQPEVVITSSLANNTFNDSSFTATFTFNESVSGFAIDDIAAVNATVSNFQQLSAALYTATITPQADGLVTLNVSAGKAQDSVGNSNLGASQYQATYDGTPPTVDITSSLTGTSSNSAFTATFTFSEDVTGFSVSDISATNATIDSFSASSGSVYTVVVTPVSEGAVILNVSANVAQDSSGNNNAAAPEFEITYDTSSPSVAISSNVSGGVTNGAFTATFTFSEAVDNFTASDVLTTNAVLGAVSATSASVYTATVTPVAEGVIILDIPANIAQDSAGNNNTAATQYSTTYDASAPTVVISSSVTGSNTNSAFTATFTFSEAVTGFAVTDINAANASLSNFASSSTTVYTATVTPGADGTVTVDVPANIAQDSAGNNNTAATQYSTTYDASAPTVAISSSVTGTTTNSAFTATFTFSEAVTGFAVTDINAANASLSNFASSSTTVYTATVTPSADGTVTVNVPANIAQDSASNNNTAATQYSTTYDASAPTVVISSSVTSSTTNTAFTATFTFSEAVTGFAVSDVSVSNAILSNFASSSTSVYTATITPSADGTVTVDVPANIAQDSASNNNTAATQYSTTYDASAPTVVISSSVTGSTTNTAFTATFTFSEAVTGFAVSDINAANASLSNFASSSTTVYTATVTPSADGTVTVNVPANIAQDSAGNNNTAATQYSTTYDASAPTVVISSSVTGSTTNGAFTATFTFSEAVTGFAVTDVSASNANLSNFNAVSTSVYSATVTPSADGTVTVNVPANIAQDSAGNNNTAATQYSTTYDASAPTVAITSSGTGSTTNGAFTVTFTFSEAVTGFAVTDISASNANVSNFVSSSSTVYTATITPSADGTVTVNVPANIAQDSAGNNNTAATQYSTTYDASAPAVAITSSVGSATNGAFTATFTFSEAVTGFAISDVSASNAILSNFASSSSTVYTATITPSADGTVTVNIPANIAQDSAGNNNTAATQYSTTYDASAPTVVISSSVTGSTTNTAFTATFTFSEAVTGFAVTDINAANASLSNFASSSTTVYTATVTPSADGTVTVNVPANIAQDSAGNNNTAATQYSTTYDASAPTVTITSSVTGTSANGAFTATFTFSEAVTGFAVTDINAANASLSNFASSSTTVYTATVTPSADGTVTVNVPANIAQDSAGNNNTAATQYSTTYDGSAPSVVIASDITGTITSGAFTATFTFSEAVTGFAVSDINAGNASVSNFASSSSTVYTATVTPTVDGAVTVDVPANVAQDESGNNNTAATQYSITYDASAPTVVISSNVTGASTNGAFTATFTFSEEVTGFDISDISAGNASVSDFVSISALAYTATVTPIDNGVVTLDVAAEAAQDSSGNNNSAAQQYSVTYDVSGPTVSITLDITDAITNDAFTATFTFSEEVTDFEASDVNAGNASVSNFVSSSSTVYTATVTPSADGVVTIDVPANVAQDTVGNGNTSATRVTITYDGTLPQLVSSTPANNDVDVDNARLQVTLTFSEEIKLLGGNIVLVRLVDNEVIETLSLLGDSVTSELTTITAIFASSLTENELYGIVVNAGSISDVAGNEWLGLDENALTFTAGNEPPGINDDSAVVDEDSEVTIAVLENDEDQSGQLDITSVVIELPPLNGTATVDTETGAITYAPNLNHNGVDSFTYVVSDTQGSASPPATVSITINPINDVPLAADDTVTTDEEQSLVIAILDNDSDVDEQSNLEPNNIEPSTVTIVDNVDSGELVIVDEDAVGNDNELTVGQVIYTPDVNFAGTDTFTYTVNDSAGAVSTVATVTINVGAVNDSPTSNDDVASTNEDEAVVINVTNNDVDSEDELDVFSVTIEGQGTLGTATVNSNTGEVTYTPSADKFGSDSFTYSVQDEQGLQSNIATVTVIITSVNDAPIAESDVYEINTRAPSSLNVLANDRDPDSVYEPNNTLDVTSVNIVSAPELGTVNVDNVTGLIIYTPNEDTTVATDTLSYQVLDTLGEVSNTATVQITLQLQSSELVANDDNASLLEDASVTIDVLANDGDTTRTLDVTSVAITQSANHGITQVNSNGFVTYTPNANYFGEDSFAYTVNDMDGDLSNEAKVIISVASVNDAPTISGSPAVSVIAGNNYQFTPSASDIDSSTLTFSIQNKPLWSVFNTSTGVLSGIANESDAGVYSNILISVTDDAGASVALSAFTIDVISTTSLTPTAIDLDVSASEDELVSFTVQATDPNNLPLTYALVQSPQSGTLTGTLPFVAYTPNENFFGQDSFTFTASNGDYISEPANVTIQVASVNDAPVAVDDQASVVEGQEVVINVLDNDSDIDSDTLTVTSASSNQGVVTLNDNLLSYQAADSFTGTVIVDYSISDNDGLSASAQVVVTVRADENKETNILLDVPEDVEVNATGLITRVTLGQATATDDLDNAVSVTLQTPPFFSPGKHSVTWQAEAGDDVQQGSQLVTVHPIITVEKSQRVQEGGRATIDVYLNGFAPEYPLSIPYSVSGSSDTDDHDLTDGIVVIESGKYGSITLDVADDDRDEGEETLIVTLDPTLNVGNAEHTLTIVEGGVAPALQLTAIQNDTSVTTIYQQAGTVDVQLSLENKESSDIQFIDWSDSANALTAINTATIDTMFSFSPESLGAGVYHIRASVTDTDGLVGFADITLRLSVELPTLTSADTDGDGIPDNIEGYGDEDGDGIADYLDATDECNVQPVNLDSEASFYIEGEVGACFRLGDIAAGTSGSVNVDQSVLPSDTDMTSTGAVVDFVISGLNEIGQTYRVVIPQQNVIPNDAVYRKYSSELESWKNFEITGSSNTIHSTEGEQGICPPPGDDLWVEGINEGHWCIQLTLSDGGPNDDDGIANGIIVDPSGLAVTANQNQLPVASDDQLAYTTGSTEVLDVLSNDTDPDNDVLTLVSVNAYLGSTEISNNELIYTPPNTFSGTDTIVYAISDGNGGTDSALVLVSVDVNNAPQAFDDTAETFSQTAITIDVLANDSDADGDVLMLIYADVDDGDVEIVDSKLLYTPPTEFIGTATITYQVEDSRGSIAEASVSVNVIEAVNEAPIAQDDSARTSNQASITVDVLDNDSDADGDELTLVNVTSTVGQAVIQNNKIVYTPESDFVGLVNVTYFVTDGETEVSATLTIQVFQQVKSEGGSVSAFFILLMLLTLIYRLNVRLGASNTNNSIEIKSRIIR